MKKIIGIFLLGMFVIVSLTVKGVNTTNNIDTNDELRPLMKIDTYTLEKWKEEYNNADKVFIDPKLEATIQTSTNYSILEYLNYVPEERDQGRCSNCWAWPATSVMEIALFIQEGIFERLSVQYINSCGEEYGGVGCCEGAFLEDFVNFYNNFGIRKAIPWSNNNAYWQDGYALCLTPCDSISTEPNYPIDRIKIENIETHNITEEEAISNIKNIKNNGHSAYNIGLDAT